jgi:hypothetical protein
MNWMDELLVIVVPYFSRLVRREREEGMGL